MLPFMPYFFDLNAKAQEHLIQTWNVFFEARAKGTPHGSVRFAKPFIKYFKEISTDFFKYLVTHRLMSLQARKCILEFCETNIQQQPELIPTIKRSITKLETQQQLKELQNLMKQQEIEYLENSQIQQQLAYLQRLQVQQQIEYTITDPQMQQALHYVHSFPQQQQQQYPYSSNITQDQKCEQPTNPLKRKPVALLEPTNPDLEGKDTQKHMKLEANSN